MNFLTFLALGLHFLSSIPPFERHGDDFIKGWAWWCMATTFVQMFPPPVLCVRIFSVSLGLFFPVFLYMPPLISQQKFGPGGGFVSLNLSRPLTTLGKGATWLLNRPWVFFFFGRCLYPSQLPVLGLFLNPLFPFQFETYVRPRCCPTRRFGLFLPLFTRAPFLFSSTLDLPGLSLG